MQQYNEHRHERSQSYDIQDQAPLVGHKVLNEQTSGELHGLSNLVSTGYRDMTHAASFHSMAPSPQGFTSLVQPPGIQNHSHQHSNILMNQTPTSHSFVDGPGVPAYHHARANSDSAIYSIATPPYSFDTRQSISSIDESGSPSSYTPLALPSGIDAQRCPSCASNNWAKIQSYQTNSHTGAISAHALSDPTQAVRLYAQSGGTSPAFGDAWNGLQPENMPQYIDYIPYANDPFYHPPASRQDHQQSVGGLESVDTLPSFQPFMSHFYPFGHTPFTPSPSFSVSPAVSPPLQPSSSRTPLMTPPTMHLPLGYTANSSIPMFHAPPSNWPSRDLSASPLSSFTTSTAPTVPPPTTSFDPRSSLSTDSRPAVQPNRFSLPSDAPRSEPTRNGPPPQCDLNHSSEQRLVDPDIVENTLEATISLPGNPVATPGEVTAFIDSSFPAGTPNYRALRAALRAVLYAKWKGADDLEPDAQLLRQFVAFSRNEGRTVGSAGGGGSSSGTRVRRTRWECLFYVAGNRGAGTCQKAHQVGTICVSGGTVSGES
ncbi:hypothetical protein FRC17_010459 [Serendipita sp. 399]|nr:hypothetical protein FRC17_010459 [Serendipita sp. 399]